MKSLVLSILAILFTFFVSGQTTNIVILNQEEKASLKQLIKTNKDVERLYKSILYEAESGLNNKPNPIETVYYEGLLETHPKRTRTMQSFADIDYVISLIYASYGNDKSEFANKAKEIIVAWANTYKPTGNPINENKFNAFYWGYHLFKDEFDKAEQQIVENWLLEIAQKEMKRERTPNNNWEAKRCKMIGIIGCILENEELKDYSIKHFKRYITTAYYADGTSRDLEQRDALHYHVSGLKPCISAFINLSQMDKRFDLYPFVSENNSSIKKSTEYVVPFATGEIQREEWRNTKVKLDKERAAAGLAEYQPGKLFEPEKAYELFEWACYYHPEWVSIFEKEEKITSWVGLLNSPFIRRTILENRNTNTIHVR